MKWLRRWCCSGIPMLGSSGYRVGDDLLTGAYSIKRILSNRYLDDLHRNNFLYPTLSRHFSVGRASRGLLVNSISSRSVYGTRNLMGTPHSMVESSLTLYRRIGHSTREEHSLSRDWVVQLWHAEKRQRNKGGKKHRTTGHEQMEDNFLDNLSRFQLPSLRSVFSRSVPDVQDRPSQHDGSSRSPGLHEEVKLAPLLARANLLITRDIEWANIMFAFEQENRYAIVDAAYPESPVGYIREQSNVIYRQLLRRRRPFTAYITDGIGNEIFRARRPFFWINSTIYVEVDGKEIGVVHGRWHLWKRVYDLYLGNKQFAVVENPGFWNWTFTLKDENENVLAQIDRDWRGVGFELFTDAGQYVIRFGDADSSSELGWAPGIQQLEVSRPLNLLERAVAVALAVSLDNDYFSRSGGWGLPILIAGE